jgi:hypothetical protein
VLADGIKTTPQGLTCRSSLSCAGNKEETEQMTTTMRLISGLAVLLAAADGGADRNAGG